MDWKQDWIDLVLDEVPQGAYRKRLEAELRDHLETQCRAFMDAGRTQDEAQTEALCVMGTPEKLKEEYEAAWRRSWPGPLAPLGKRVGAWAGGYVVMTLMHYLAFLFLLVLWQAAAWLISVSRNPQIKLLQDAMEYLDGIYFTFWFPLLLALTAGAFYLRYKFQALRHPAWRITVGLSCHWASVTAFHVWWYMQFEPHLPLEEAVTYYLGRHVGYYSFTFLLCILLGVVFGMLPAKTGKPAAA